MGLTIDLMALMHTGGFDEFVLTSSNSDFARWASRLREQGLQMNAVGSSNAKALRSDNSGSRCRGGGLGLRTSGDRQTIDGAGSWRRSLDPANHRSDLYPSACFMISSATNRSPLRRSRVSTRRRFFLKRRLPCRCSEPHRKPDLERRLLRDGRARRDARPEAGASDE